MKTIKSLKDITTLEVGDKVLFGDLEYEVHYEDGYFLSTLNVRNDTIFTNLNISKKDFVKNLGINTLPTNWDFPEVCSLEALTAIVSALFKEYEKQKELPKTWVEFCERYPVKEGECFITETGGIHICHTLNQRFSVADQNVCTSKQEAEAFLALMQLRQLRKCYVGDWEPDWINEGIKYCIEVDCNALLVHSWYHKSHILSFPSRGLAEQFLTNFKDLLEIAKPLI